MEQAILDDFRMCKDPDCANPVLLERALKGENLNQEEQSRLLFFLDECQQCQEYFLKQLEEIKLKMGN